MACGGCAKRRAVKALKRQNREDTDLMGGYANLTDRQIKTRLEMYKRRYCQGCTKRYECDYECYLKCKKNNN